MKNNPVVFVVSDSMGETAQLVAKAVMSQFPEGTIGLRRFNHIETPDAAQEVMRAARDQPTMIILRPAIERMFVTTSAFDADAQESGRGPFGDRFNIDFVIRC